MALMMTEHDLSKRIFGINALFAAAGWMAVGMPSPLAGQAGTATTPASSSPGNTPYLATMTYDVASVRENKNADPNIGITMSGVGFVPHTSMFHAINWSIENLIGVAYGVNRSEIVGVPKWTFPTVFVIEAKGDKEADARIAALTQEQQSAEQRHMLQALLEDRFKLKTHWETKEGDVYHLVVAKGGPKLGPEGSAPPSTDEQKRFGDRPVPALYQKNDGVGYDFIAHSCSMARWVEMLTAQFGRPVSDETGLKSNYDFVLKYKGRWDRDRNPDDLDPTPPMDRALQEQLGLKVEAAKGSVRVLVIDHIEKPSEN
jgi:uncharacterized protein (TIGR03435 family)